MNKETENLFYSSSDALNLLKWFILNPKKILDKTTYKLSPQDFSLPYSIIFSSINNIAFKGANVITEENLLDEIRKYPQGYAKFQSSLGEDVVHTLFESTEIDPSIAEAAYERIKKFTTLRTLKLSGFPVDGYFVSDFLNEDNVYKRIDETDIHSIIAPLKLKLDEIENNNAANEETCKDASNGLEEMVARLKEEPDIGVPTDGAMLNYIVRGCRLGKLYLYSAPSGSGKALPNDTIIPLFNGEFKAVGDIKVGDTLIDRLGKPTKVLQIFPQGKKEVYEITFKSGRKAKCNDEHLWSYKKKSQRGSGQLKTSTLREIINEGSKTNYKNRDGYIYLVPINQAVQYEEKSYKISPYVFGLMLGDGSFRQHPTNKAFQYSSQDIELVESIAKELNGKIKKNSDKNYTWYFGKDNKNIYVEDVLSEFPELINAYSQDKFIPKKYLLGSESQRWDLLAGLMDTDGSVDTKGRCRFTTISKKLCDDFVFLCRSLGIRTTIREDRREEKYTTGICYEIALICRPLDKLKMFKLTRKYNVVENYLKTTKRFESNDYDAIIDIKCLNYSTEMTCFLVDNDEHLFLMNDFIVTHNTRTMLSNACNISLPYWDGKKVCNTEHRQKVLFIATEMDHEEIQRLVLAHVSGVDSETINDGAYSPADEEKLKKAIEIIKQYKDNFLIEYLPNPSISSVKSMIERHIEQDKVGYIFYDYIFSSPGLVTEFASSKIREDVGLMMLSNTLKEIATTHKVFIMSATQLSGDWEGAKFRNMGYIRGSKAVADKVDIGMIGVRLSGEEKQHVEKILGPNEMSPNIVVDIYKNRSGRAVEIKLFRYFDYATCRSYDCFVTDAEYNRLDEYKKKVLEVC